MANEKLMILKMLEEGKITSEEAARLLESVDRPGTRSAAPPPRPYEDRSNNHSRGPARSTATPPPAGSSGGRSFDELASDLGRRFEAISKDLEPKLQKLTETVAEKIVVGADRLSKTFTPEPVGVSAPMSGERRAAPTGGGYDKNIELTVSAGYNELSLSGLNGDVRLKGYNGDKITARITYKPKRGNPPIELMRLGGKYFLNYEEDDFERVSVDAYIPERLFNIVNVGTINGNLDVSSIAAHEMQFNNANGQTRLAGLAAKAVKADCSTGRLTLSAITAESAIIENFNGVVDAAELDVANLSLTNCNGALTLLMSSFTRYDGYLWSVETSNAKLTLNVPTLPDLGYHIKAHTTLGDIRLGLTGMQFFINDPTLVEARSISFDRASKTVKLAVETSNAPLMIN